MTATVGAAELLERDGDLAVLTAALARAADGDGGVAIVSGEAGIGKTTLLEAFASQARERKARVLVGACDDLLSPRTFGPFRDMVRGGRGPLGRAFADGAADGDTVLAALLDEATSPLEATVLVVDDVQWADEATLDAVRFLGRRLRGTTGLLVVAHRDDLPPAHPLRAVLGALTGPSVVRITLRRLSPDAVTTLVGDAPLDPVAVHAVTSGNPFFVSEVLATPAAPVPPTVRDAVLARVAALPAPTREALEVLAVAPRGLASDVLSAVLPDPEAIAEAEHRGIVAFDGTQLRYRHEIARQAVEESMPAAIRRSAHARVLAASRAAGAEPAVLVHHAVGAGDVDAIVASAPQAAALAARAGSHREATARYAEVLAHADRLTDAEAADLRRRYAWELSLVGRAEEAVTAAEAAVAARERSGDAVALGEALITLAVARYWAVDAAGALDAAERAVALLAGGPARAEARALATLAFVLVMRNRYADAVPVARRGAALAEQAGDPRVQARALAQEGTALLLLGDEAGRRPLEQALRLARAIPDHEAVVVACTGLVSGSFRLGRLADAERAMAIGLADADDHDLVVGASTLRMMRHGLDLSRGSWVEAERGLRRVIGDGRGSGWGETVALALLGRLLARRGDPHAATLVARAWDLAARSEEIQRLGPAGVAALELAWLSGDSQHAAERAAITIDLAARVGHTWYLGEVLRYGALLDAIPAPDPTLVARCPEPWASALRGDTAAAAAAWQERGCPYERAVELVTGGDAAAVLEGLGVLDGLGATATAAFARRRLRDLGVARIPRGPVESTRRNAAGLTARQVDVLRLLAEGLTNAAIARRLVVSPRTVDHHVAAILAKLEVPSRREAAAKAAELGLLDG